MGLIKIQKISSRLTHEKDQNSRITHIIAGEVWWNLTH